VRELLEEVSARSRQGRGKQVQFFQGVLVLKGLIEGLDIMICDLDPQLPEACVFGERREE
jgi:hypothetical protein